MQPTQTSALNLTAQEYEILKVNLKQINLKAQRLQTSTGLELALRQLQWRFVSFAELIGPVKSATVVRTQLDKEWNNCRRIEIPVVRAYLQQTDVAGETVALAELKKLLDLVPQLDSKIGIGDWGTVDQHCRDFSDVIDDAIL